MLTEVSPSVEDYFAKRKPGRLKRLRPTLLTLAACGLFAMVAQADEAAEFTGISAAARAA